MLWDKQLAETSGVFDLTRHSIAQLHPHAARDNDTTPLKDNKKDGAGEQAAQLAEAGVAMEIEAERRERDGTFPPEAAAELYSRAATLYRRAARQGHLQAALALARLHERGVGLTPPPGKLA